MYPRSATNTISHGLALTAVLHPEATNAAFRERDAGGKRGRQARRTGGRRARNLPDPAPALPSPALRGAAPRSGRLLAPGALPRGRAGRWGGGRDGRGPLSPARPAPPIQTAPRAARSQWPRRSPPPPPPPPADWSLRGRGPRARRERRRANRRARGGDPPRHGIKAFRPRSADPPRDRARQGAAGGSGRRGSSGPPAGTGAGPRRAQAPPEASRSSRADRFTSRQLQRGAPYSSQSPLDSTLDQ